MKECEGGETMRAGTAKGQEGNGRGGERGGMRFGSGMAKKGVGRRRYKILEVGKRRRYDERKERACLRC